MKRRVFAVITAMAFFLIPVMAQEKANYEIQYGVKQISRICPTFIWDSWQFEKIEYDTHDSCVTFVIQGPHWSESQKPITKEKMSKAANWIANEFIEAYESNIREHTLLGDGDFMLYLATGNLLHKMVNGNVSLRLCIRPYEYNATDKDLILNVLPQQIAEMLK